MSQRRGVRAGLAGGCLVVALILLPAAPAAGAFEALGLDPVGLGLGGAGPSWAVDGQPLASGSAPFGRLSPAGALAAAVRWADMPDLHQEMLAAWISKGRSVLILRGRRLSIDSYSESMLEVEAGLLQPGGGWGGTVSLGTGSWSAGGYGNGSAVAGASLGFAPRPAIRFAARWSQPLSGGADSAAQPMEFGLSVDPCPGWTVGAGFGSSGPGGFGRVGAGVECRPADGYALRAGLLPTDGALDLGIGIERGALRIDVGRRDHPRLGRVAGVSLAVVSGGDRVP